MTNYYKDKILSLLSYDSTNFTGWEVNFITHVNSILLADGELTDVQQLIIRELHKSVMRESE